MLFFLTGSFDKICVITYIREELVLMSRLELRTPNRTHIVMEELYKDLERRIESSPPGLCPVDMSRAFLELCHAQTCGKCDTMPYWISDS